MRLLLMCLCCACSFSRRLVHPGFVYSIMELIVATGVICYLLIKFFDVRLIQTKHY